MKRLSSLGAMAAMFSLLSPNLDGFKFMEGPRSRGKRRGLKKHKQAAGRSRYMPHIGAKEQERAKRCYMENGILQQMSKRQFDVLRNDEPMERVY